MVVSGDRLFVVVGAYAFGDSPAGAPEVPLWVSDGTTEGTSRVARIRTRQHRLDAAGNPLLFAQADELLGVELWTTGGASDGPRLVADLEPGEASSNPQGFVQTRHGVFFIARGKLYRSDGTAAGTVELADISGSRLVLLGELGGRSILGASTGTARGGLWGSDGTPGGTDRVAVPSASAGAQLGETILFTHTSSTARLWLYDGADVRAIGSVTPSGQEFAVHEDRAFFFGRDGTASALWVTDGTDVGTSSIASLPWGRDLTAFADGIAFVGPDGVYASNGASVRLLWDGPSHDLVGFDGALYFFSDHRFLRSDGEQVAEIADFRTQQTRDGIVRGIELGGRAILQPGERYLRGGAGRTLWTSDGTPEGTSVFAELPTSGLVYYSGMTSRAGAGLFVQFSPQSAPPEWALWTTDGTEAGTLPLFTAGLRSGSSAQLLDDGHRLFVTDDASGWSIDPSLSQATPIIPSGIVSVAGDATRSFVLATNGDLYVTDGTQSGTRRLHTFAELRQPIGLVVLAGRAILTTAGELHENDGRPAATGMLLDSGVVSQPVVAGTRAFFFRNVGGTIELWALEQDGTVQRVAPVSSADYRTMVSFGHRLLFSGWTPETGAELWISDGTEAGTRLVSDIFPGPEGSAPMGLTVTGDRAWFFADDGVHGIELWTTDGTTAGTNLVHDANPGSDSIVPGPFFPAKMLVAGGRLYFNGYTVDHGVEPWSVPLLPVTCGDGRMDPFDDGDPCTVDACDESTQTITHTPIGGCGVAPPIMESDEGCGCTAANRRGGSMLLLVVLLAIGRTVRTSRRR